MRADHSHLGNNAAQHAPACAAVNDVTNNAAHAASERAADEEQLAQFDAAIELAREELQEIVKRIGTKGGVVTMLAVSATAALRVFRETDRVLLCGEMLSVSTAELRRLRILAT